MPPGAKAKGIGWGVGGCAAGWVIKSEEDDKEEGERFVTLVNWGKDGGKEAWEASVQGKKFEQLWGERALREMQRWAARMRVERRRDWERKQE